MQLTLNRWQETQKDSLAVWAEIQAHRQIAPTVYAHPDPQLLNKMKREPVKNNTKFVCGNEHILLTDLSDRSTSGKIAGLHSNWKKRIGDSSNFQPSSRFTTPSVSTAATSTAQQPQAQAPEILLTVCTVCQNNQGLIFPNRL